MEAKNIVPFLKIDKGLSEIQNGAVMEPEDTTIKNITTLKAKDFKILDELILDGIRKCLKNEKIKEEIIEQYINETDVICFTKTKGSKYVSRLNKACEVVKFFPELIDLKSSYQFV